MSPPFLFVNHGVLAAYRVGKGACAFLGFRAPVPTSARREVLVGVPPPLRGTVAWGETLLGVGSMGDAFRFDLTFEYGTDEERDEGALEDVLSDEIVADYAADFESWCRRVHERYPLSFVVSTLVPVEMSDWGAESHRQGAAVLVPFLEAYVDAHAEDVEIEELENENWDPEGLRFDRRHMSILLACIPDAASTDLRARAETLRHRFT